MQIDFITSKDGSHTLFLPHLNETYHSLHGAVKESEYVYVDKGLAVLAEKKDEITVFEIGFGTGLNALLTLIFSLDKSIKINYHTLEPFPLSKEIFTRLNYIELLQKENLREDFYKMHESEGGEIVQVNENFNFCRYRSTLENYTSLNVSPDLIYYDAFAPSKQPEIWSLDNLKKIKSMIIEEGILVTYCASGQFKRDLKEAGFRVEVLQGPPGKNQMTRGLS
jgi:tRNA U34 5-methylaminomethyl-2-thiouridine-forming methyltransferase MnmC